MKLTDLVLADRITLVYTTRDLNLLYDLIEKLLNKSHNEVVEMYKFEGDFIMNRVTITGRYYHLYTLFDMLTRLGMEFESLTPTSIRVDISKFIQIVK